VSKRASRRPRGGNRGRVGFRRWWRRGPRYVDRPVRGAFRMRREFGAVARRSGGIAR
jgi:hypothetical protein